MRNVNESHAGTLNFTERSMLVVATWVGSETFVLFCILLTFTPLVFPSTLAIVQFISSGFLQLVLLPIILIASNLQSRHDQLRADNDYEVNMKAESEIRELHRKLDTLLKGRNTIDQ